ncbi:hypothetical protein WG68_10790 [Arsukibacterium ikkense]|uniref:DUF3016 domain-containing protein n=1 Tax=Arsukibacterium ikkense TaxID=336831 RepID=A0A0M2V4E3_9GAMM|nr:DUF3016 domain-containing protein [Arsukibacterium ikkense]KKO45516.1 hypothetical protein WG68_10790 [Arsukibacterium ikkense]
MKKFLIATIALVWSAAAFSTPTVGAELEVNWQEPEKFTDIRAANDSRSRFQARVMRNFEKFFQEIANELPEGYSWQVTITDVDLAGEVDFFATSTGQPIRVIKEIHSPAIRFNHLLRDQYGEEVVGGEERFRDMGFMSRMSPRGNTPEFEFERVMLQDWFKKQLQPKITAHASLPPKVSNPER